MIRTIIKPDNQNIIINLPENFIGKQVEVIAFTIEETEKNDGQTLTPFASQKVLEKDWSTPKEDLAWRDL